MENEPHANMLNQFKAKEIVIAQKFPAEGKC